MKKYFTSILFLTVLALISEGDAFDPCVDYEMFDQTLLGSRNEICPRPDDPYKRLCDYRLAPNWYLIPHNGVLQNSCPVNGSCGTELPVWLNGNLPIESDGIVNMTCCIKILEDCCGDNITIQVKNCSNMILYYFPSLEYCDSVYCIETDLPCEQTTTTTTTSTTPVVTTESVSASTTTGDRDEYSDDKTSMLIGICIGLGVLLCIVAGIAVYFINISKRCKNKRANISPFDNVSGNTRTELTKPSTPPPPYEASLDNDMFITPPLGTFMKPKI